MDPFLSDAQRPVDGAPFVAKPSTDPRVQAHPPKAEYSWDGLSRHRKREVLAMVSTANGKRRAQLIGLLVLLVLVLAALGAAYYFLA